MLHPQGRAVRKYCHWPGDAHVCVRPFNYVHAMRGTSPPVCRYQRLRGGWFY